MRDYEGTLEWYRENQTARQIGFDPDGMCLKVCRTARGIGSRYASAKDAMEATPERHRVRRVRDLRRGMVLYYADPNDSNRYDHIVTMIGRVPGFDPDDLHDVLVETNSVKANELVVVRGTYFHQHWGDPFVFGATWLNGVELDVPSNVSRVQQFKRSGPRWNVNLLDAAVKAGRRDVQHVRDGLDRQIKRLPDDPGLSRVDRVVRYYERHRIIKMRLLNEAVNEGNRVGLVKDVRNDINRLIKSLPDR